MSDGKKQDGEWLDPLHEAWEKLGSHAPAPRSELGSDDAALMRRGWDVLLQDTPPAFDASGGDSNQWMRDAWKAVLEPQAPPVPFELARRVRQRAVARWTRRAGAAAAVLLATAVFAFTALRPSEGPGTNTPNLAPHSTPRTPVDAAPSPVIANVPRIVPISDVVAAPLETYDTSAVSNRQDGFEYVKGKVRVVLLAPRSNE